MCFCGRLLHFDYNGHKSIIVISVYGKAFVPMFTMTWTGDLLVGSKGVGDESEVDGN